MLSQIKPEHLKQRKQSWKVCQEVVRVLSGELGSILISGQNQP